MPSPLKILQTNSFAGGVNADIADELVPHDACRYMLNCNVLSSAEGNVGVVTNILGNTLVSVELPPGLNKTIGVALDEESNYFYYAVWNSEGFHTWYRYGSVGNTVDVVVQSKTDSADVDIFGWLERVLILGANVIENNLLYWVMEGQPPRKIDIRKAMDKSDSGYGATILEEYTRAYKRTSLSSPTTTYFTDETKKFNRLFGNQFQFAQRYIYDNKERSEVSDWSTVPNPTLEYFTGTQGIPFDNNGINVTVETGSNIVKSIEILMRRTNPEGGTLPWVLVTTLDKDFLDIESGSTYTFSFYNDGAYVAVDPKYPIRNNSSMPRLPKGQDYTKNALMYSNSVEGRDQVKIDVSWEVEYQDVFIDDGTADELNSPSFVFNQTNQGAQPTGSNAWRWITGTFIVGPDVVAGNIFTMYAVSTIYGQPKTMTFSVVAEADDDAESIANKMAAQLRTSNKFDPSFGRPGGFVQSVTAAGGGSYGFNVRIMNNAGWSYWVVSTWVPPVNTVTLKDNGQSVRNIKNGSSTKYGIVYRDEDGRKELVQTNDTQVVSISTMNELGGIKKPVITFSINHRPPMWAKDYSIVRTKDLVYASYIQFYIQTVTSIVTGSGDQYDDLSVGSLYTYQALHPNTILAYEFKKGDRVRVMYQWNGSEFDVVADAKDFEVIEYNPVVEDIITSEITVDGSSVATTTSASSRNIGSYIRIGDSERLIVGAVDGTSYTLNSDYPVDGTDFTYPSFEIINRRGTIRIKHDPDFPISPQSVVELYRPATGDASVSDDQFYEFSQRFDIIDWGTDNAYHAGNVQDQDAGQPAQVRISAGSSYVRNRELPTNNNPDNPQVRVAIIEDPNYSDFYVSDMTDDGKLNVVDQGYGERRLSESIWWSGNYIERTQINGLNDFEATSRRDYNDKYGSIQLILFSEDRLYVFKHLKTAWATVYARRITETNDAGMIAASPDILPDMLTYFLWDGGVGNNPESVCRNGNNICAVYPDSGVIIRLGLDGTEDISKTYFIDSDARKLIRSSKQAGAFIFTFFTRRNDNWEFTFEPHETVVYDSGFSESGWEISGSPLPSGIRVFNVISGPSHGSAPISGPELTYSPDPGYSGPDTLRYEAFVDGVSQGERNICIDVVYAEGPKAWRPINPYCITRESGIPCGVSNSYSGGVSFPTTEEIYLGENTGTVQFSFDAIGVPDKFTVEFDGVIVIDTGYRGSTGYQGALDVALAGMGLPPETITSPASGTASFVKSTSTTTATVKVYAPLPGTGWNFLLGCPE